jgi:hypothetical protein
MRMSVESEKQYRRLRRSILSNANGKCVKCGNPATEVHHVNGREDASLKNLRPLCNICHWVAPNGEAYWEWESCGKSGSEAIHDRILADMSIQEGDRDVFEEAFRITLCFWRDCSISRNTREALSARKSNGFPAGPAPYGWTSQLRTEAEKRARIPKPLLINEAEQKIIGKARSMRDSGLSYEKIATALNELGYRARSGSLWAKQYVIGILKNAEVAVNGL